MLGRFARVNLRRYMHTLPSRPQSKSYSGRRLRLALGASTAAAAATYLTWRWTSDDHKIALDAQENAAGAAAAHHKVKSRNAVYTHPDTTSQDRTGTDDPVPPSSDSHSQPHETTATTATNEAETPAADPQSPSSPPSSQEPTAQQQETDKTVPSDSTEGPDAEEAGDGGAFNPVTGEINWDCPCLGGMAHGPCGPQFREAFSCFVFSDKEPKGVDCVEKFKAMQDCFREHPDVYADEIMRDEEADGEQSSTSEDSVEKQPIEEGEKDPTVAHQGETADAQPSQSPS